MTEIEDAYFNAFTQCIIGKDTRAKKIVILFNFGQTVDSEKDLVPQIHSLYLSSAVTDALSSQGFDLHTEMFFDAVNWTTPIHIVNKVEEPICIRGYTTHFMDQAGLPVDLNYFISLIKAGIFFN